jgi:glutaredoxin
MSNINIFTKDGCPMCDFLCGTLKEANVEFNKIDAGVDVMARSRLIASGKTDLPVIEYDGKLVDYIKFKNDILPSLQQV